MKYIIQESRIKKFLNIYLEDRLYTSSFLDNSDYIVIAQKGINKYTIEYIILQYDRFDSTLIINEDFLNNVNSIFPIGLKKNIEMIKDWFESKYDVVVKSIKT